MCVWRSSGLEREAYAGGLGHQLIDLIQSRANLLELHFIRKREVQVLGEPIVPEVAALQRSAALEDE